MYKKITHIKIHLNAISAYTFPWRQCSTVLWVGKKYYYYLCCCCFFCWLCVSTTASHLIYLLSLSIQWVVFLFILSHLNRFRVKKIWEGKQQKRQQSESLKLKSKLTLFTTWLLCLTISSSAKPNIFFVYLLLFG